ncbi:hypothetical protein QOZ80_7BG0589270 [Eleusine coracana subsp. coracana]|nr:hypothetical protein QOZ80_7BG0589270 [Eleusine coracana subsp. coracana]
MFFVSRFQEGLRDDIRSVIALHRPLDMDTASSLALLQEEELENGKRRSLPRADHSKQMPARLGFSTEKHKKPEVEGKKEDHHMSKMEDKVASLKAYRRSKGLCFKCGDKWSHNHICPTQVPIHVIEELLNILQIEVPAEQQVLSDSEEDTDLRSVAEVTTSGPRKRRTIKLQGMMGKHQVLLLVDSGSVGTFVNADLVQRLHL